MPVREILQLGNPLLRVRCGSLTSFEADTLRSLTDDLRDTLYDFKSRNGFGRGIAAPQIGDPRRVIFIHVDEPVLLVNPTIVKRSRRLVTLWDDCFSFPTLMVKLHRHLTVEVRYLDESGHKRMLKADGALSELLQHEIDHIDGVLAIDRAIDSKHIVYRSEYMKWAKDKEGAVM